MEVLVSKHNPDAGEFEVIQELIRPETGETYLQRFVFPEDTLEWRAAEYQIEPGQTDLLMDVVLYEHFIPRDPDNPMPVLITAKTIADARSIHLDRVMEVKEQLRPQGPNKWKSNPQRLDRLAQANPALKVNWAGFILPDALQSIRDNHVMEHEVLQEKVLNVENHRRMAAVRMRGFAERGSRAKTTKQRVETLRAMRAQMEQGNLDEQQ